MYENDYDKAYKKEEWGTYPHSRYNWNVYASWKNKTERWKKLTSADFCKPILLHAKQIYSKVMENLEKQVEEIDTLKAIYGEEFQTEDEENRKYSIRINSDHNKNIYVILYVKFPDSYPSSSPPTFEISAPYLELDKKRYLCNLLEDVYLSFIGQNVIFQWIEKIREELQSESSDQIDALENEVLNVEPEIPVIKVVKSTCPTITHGEVILDRKSTFQGHAATVHSDEEVRQVINKLNENRKIQQATHNIYAFRILNENNKSFIHDCDDDGEDQAGSRLLHLLEIMNAKNVFVMVSRWYGGIHLGPDRFKHINNAARQVLTAVNLVPESKK